MGEFFNQQSLLRNVINSGILIVVVWLIRYFLIRSIHVSTRRRENKLELVTTVRNISIIFGIFGLGIVWGSELKNFALSLVAIAAAIVIATKELILCFLGGVLKAISRPFKIGDRIEINHLRGDVISHDFLTITVLEIGPNQLVHQYSGKRVIIPNSWLLTYAVINETKKFRYGLHSFSMGFPHSAPIEKYRDVLSEAASEVCSAYIDKAQLYMKNIGYIEGLEAPSAEPRVSISFTSGTQIDLIARVPIPSLASAKTEQAIISLFLKKINQ